MIYEISSWLIKHLINIINKNSRSSRPEVFCKKGILKNFTQFTGKHLCQSLFLIQLQAEACNVIKIETLAQVFSCGFYEIFKNTYSIEHLWCLLLHLRKTQINAASLFYSKHQEKHWHKSEIV